MTILKHSFVLFYPVQCRKSRSTRRGRRIHCAGNIWSAKYIYDILVALIRLTVEPILNKGGTFVSTEIKFWNLQWFSNRLWHQFQGKTRTPRKPLSIVFWTSVGHLKFFSCGGFIWGLSPHLFHTQSLIVVSLIHKIRLDLVGPTVLS